MAKRPLVKTNAQALRWCRTRRVYIEIGDWHEKAKGAPRGISFRIRLGKYAPVMYGKTLIKTVNAWVKFFNKREGSD